MPNQDARQHMRECEARYWLRQGYTTPEKIAELRQRLKQRGPQALDLLVEEMRRQWKRRADWL